eukprot:m.49649 g.49649  ORF g.49649 m.49649 type:complete len:530 (-) comp21080_c0_seq1:304-1893(-)
MRRADILFLADPPTMSDTEDPVPLRKTPVSNAPVPFGTPQKLTATQTFKISLIEKQIESMGKAIGNLLPITKGEKDVAEKLNGYASLYQQYLLEEETKIDWELISPPPEGMVKPWEELPKVTSTKTPGFRDALSKLAVLKLNGGLGTSMGCKGPKSAISVRDGLTFLDMTVLQIESLQSSTGVSVPLVLMNSFNTDKDTQNILQKYRARPCIVKSFNQSQFPRIRSDTSQPAAQDFKNMDEWYPPGHGDMYRSLYNSGLLDDLIADGKEYLFVSNIDNLGATINNEILEHFHTSPDCEFVMEVTDKTLADVKGGTLIEYEGKIRLLEIAQVEKEHVNDFKSITQFRIFNTNNLWVKLKAIKRLMEAEALHMEIIENKKKLKDGTPVIQLEQAVGSAIKNFNGAIGINVPRSRFLPVKQSQDLLLVMSDLFEFANGALSLSPKRVFPTLPLVKLGADFKGVEDFLRRFETIPKVLNLDHLTVAGDVNFGRNVTLKGTVIIICNEGEHIDIPDGSVLENKIITGNLRILDH